MTSNNTEKRVPVYKLLNHKTILKQLLSFSENVERCNFSIRKGWGSLMEPGKLYINEHGLDEHKPVDLRGVILLELYYIKMTDYVILTDEQYKDYRIIAGLDV